MGKMLVFGGSSGKTLCAKICSHIGIEEGKVEISRFPDGEINIVLGENIRGADVFWVQPTCPPVNENLMELLLAIDALKRASAQRITAVIPYYGYARQDRKHIGRVPISARLVANLIERSGANRVIALELHAGQIQGFFDIPVDNFFADRLFAEILKPYVQKEPENTVVVAPDLGGVKRARALAEDLNIPLVIVEKRRLGPKSTETLNIIGEIREKRTIIYDDIISTGTTILDLISRLLEKEKIREITVAAVHGIFAGNAADRFNELPIRQILVSNSFETIFKLPKSIEYLDISPDLAEIILRTHENRSVSEVFQYT